jgi:hypothetical protein
MGKASHKVASSHPIGTKELQNPEVLANLCLPVLRQKLANQQIGFKAEPRVRSLSSYKLCGRNQQFGEARENYPIHLFRAGVAELYWVAVTLEFRYTDPRYELVGAQIIVFSGNARQRKKPLLRAEWHCSREDLDAIHAQPHWHVYAEPWQPTGKPFGQKALTDFTAAEAQRAEDNQSDAELLSVPFHFAMSSQWHIRGADSHRHEIPDVDSLQGWLSGCLAYIHSELT